MARGAQINNKARLGVAALILVLLLPAAMLLRNCMGSSEAEKFVPPASVDFDEIVQVGETTMLLERGSIGSRIIEWHGTANSATHAVEVADAIFQRGSPLPTPDGRVRIGRFAELMRAHPALTAKIVVTAGGEAPILQERAAQLRRELVAKGVADRRVELIQKTATAANEPSSIVVVLSRRTG